MSAARWTAAEALPGRDRPDASEKPSGRVEAGSVLIELERLGLWIRVGTPDDKRFWVDGRRLQAVAAAPEPDRPPPQTPQQLDPVPAAPIPKPAPPLQTAALAWTVTHTVPAGGLQAWATPDPAGAVTATLAERVELRVIERRSDWAHVDAENGWKGWVDGRQLVTVGGATPSPQQPNATPTPHPAFTPTAAAETSVAKRISLRSVAAFLVPISALLPWFGSWFGSGSTTATDVPAAFLWSPWTDLSFPNMGTVMFVVGAAVLVTEFMNKYFRYRKIAAGVVVGVVALYLIQMFRLMLDYEGEFTTAVATMFTEAFAIGPWVALAAGTTLLVKRQTKPAGAGT